MTNFEKMMAKMTPDKFVGCVAREPFIIRLIMGDGCRKIADPNDFCPTYYDDGYPMSCEDCFLAWLEEEAE